MRITSEACILTVPRNFSRFHDQYDLSHWVLGSIQNICCKFYNYLLKAYVRFISLRCPRHSYEFLWHSEENSVLAMLLRFLMSWPLPQPMAPMPSLQCPASWVLPPGAYALRVSPTVSPLPQMTQPWPWPVPSSRSLLRCLPCSDSLSCPLLWLNCAPHLCQFICWRSHPQYLRMWLYLKVFKEVVIKMDLLGWP